MDVSEPARRYLAAIEQLDEVIARLRARELERAERKLAAIERLVQQTSPATGKPFSFSQADDLATLDPEYRAYKGDVVKDERLRLRREAEAECARAALWAGSPALVPPTRRSVGV